MTFIEWYLYQKQEDQLVIFDICTIILCDINTKVVITLGIVMSTERFNRLKLRVVKQVCKVTLLMVNRTRTRT